MNIEIYYFSGTGNSLAVARDITKKINGTLISIPTVLDKQNIKTDAHGIVIVFPAYLAHLYGIPLVVEQFIKKLKDIGSKRIFAVCTCGAYESVNALPALRNLAKLIKLLGGRLAAEYSVRLPMNNLNYAGV
jgi:flavodoxin